ncbi:relaxase/mobilization nuclease domain-containing protein [Caproiciproducens sp. CPB-2]|uniref:relaxase/mobilization nuclease domain-containing protein n=1 Tax=Caproiciproducens sp. CPB-2 TaxID=3030017 RepID=UPI0023DB23D1|nr:relaxase/mobilization nuclease domain-containing protein [Caproiciproducens sp. CPB-2]MDF1494558.1 relaxase/mobilization nuclease domain-containing protein [Caproiciproducens sp. CPB-2]
MAYTSIWSVKGWLGKVVIYAENPDKTENPAYFEKQGMTAEQAQGLSDVIDYAAQSRKTELTDESAEILRHYVTGINCSPETARDEMMAAKKKFGKEDGVVAYHGIQSFAPGEIDPDTAHEIGVKLARQLWGDKYQVLVTTHLDKASHLHSHFVVNTVSWVDGIRYHRTERDYYNMQIESDKLCREYGLSVIEEPKRGKSKHYGEWQAEKNNKPTYRSLLKADVDLAIAQSMTERQFWDAIKKMGYHVKYGQDITLRPEGKDRGLKLLRNFGEDYSIGGIRKRILANTRPQRRIVPADPPPKQLRFVGKLNKARRITGLRALYFSYLYKMGVLPKHREPNPKRVYFLFREDIRFIQNISRETRLLVKHGIDTAEQLAAHKDSLTQQVISLSSARKHLRYQTRSIGDEGKLAEVKTEIASLSQQIAGLRKEVRLCEDIDRRSVDMKEKIRIAAEEEKSNGKESKQHESVRGRR